MKKIILISALCILTGLSSFAQNFRLGLTASPTISWFSAAGDQVAGDGSRVGIEYGLLYEPTLGSIKRYAISTGLIIDMAGATVAAIDSAGNTLGSSTLKFQYIEIPLTLKLRTNEVNYITYYGQFGLTPGVNIKASGTFKDANGNTIPGSDDVNLKNKSDLYGQYKPVDLSLTIGGGIEYAITESTSIVAGLFFQNGFTNTYDDVIDTNNSISLKQLGLRLGVLF